ncbi:hypothetical protein HYC85_015099 [Camellia sinensis]|uniref:DUF7798 domain-containing protein n=1 Tax=Camellia sinensis TaxID=4442 RepID=A0A7J7H872_CAMSI|nr:hypothetical protein HYC85_015099 [Camellia sinensis]
MLLHIRRSRTVGEDLYYGNLKQVQQIFSSSSEIDGSATASEKGKKIEIGAEGSADEMKNLHDSSVKKATEMAARNNCFGLSVEDSRDCCRQYYLLAWYKLVFGGTD